MKCPHCQVEFHGRWVTARWPNAAALPSPGERSNVSAQNTLCPQCRKRIIRIRAGRGGGKVEEYVAYPRYATGRTAPPEVPEPLRSDYAEAVAILDRSPQASAALARRIVQQVLAGKGGYEQRTLARQIGTFVEDERTPSELSRNLHYLREIGNFAAHPIKSERTGEIMPVEPDEAEWALEVVDRLFDYYFVAPGKDEARRREFDGRAADAGRPSPSSA